MTVISERLAEAMADAGVDQTALAREINVTQGTISLILLGKTHRSKHLPAIANFLGVSLTWLSGFDDLKYPGPDQMLLRPHERDLVEKMRLLANGDLPAFRTIMDALIIKQAISKKVATLIPVGQGLPARGPLVEMFKGILQNLDLSASLDELAGELAELLPIGLSQLKGPMFEHPTTDREAAKIAFEAVATGDHVSQA